MRRRKSEDLTESKLRQILISEDVDPNSYDLGGGLPSEKYVLAHANGQWCVYYSERGMRGGLRCYDDEHEACRDLLERIRAGHAPWDGYNRLNSN